MSTVAIFNGFGRYEQTNDGQKGMTLLHAGIPFWFPYDQVTYIPDFTMREVDHDKSTANGEEEGVLTYRTFRLSGERIAEELLETGIPFKESEKGLMVITATPAKRKTTTQTIFSGVSEEGTKLFTDVPEIEPTEYEIAEAHNRARAFKEQVIQQYFQTKRERMAGGHGQLFPTGLIRVYMTELGVRDIDDVTRQLETAAATPGITLETLTQLIQAIVAASKSEPAAVIPEPPKSAKAKAEQKGVESLV